MDKPTRPFHPPDSEEISAYLRESREQMPVRENSFGYIAERVDRWAVCGGCGDKHVLDGDKARFTISDDLRDAGWRNTKTRGWLCPGCYAMHQIRKSKPRMQANK